MFERISETVRSVLARGAGLLLTLLGASLVTFVISHMIPTDAARLMAGDGASEAVVARLRADMGLDQPVPVQYLRYLGDLAQGDFGVSIRSGEPVMTEILRVAPATFELALAAFLLIVVISLTFGCWAAVRRDRLADQIIRTLSAVAISTPTFWIALLLIAVFAAQMGWAPLGGRLSADTEAPPTVSGLFVLDSILSGRPATVIDALVHLALPAITLALAASGSAIRLIRASLLEVLGQDYVLRARAAGLSEFKVLTAYALPNALIPFVTTMGLLLADLLGGAIITEMVFGWPGLGGYTLEAIAGLDFPAIMGFTILAAAIYGIANLIVDLLNGALDPRARRAK